MEYKDPMLWSFPGELQQNNMPDMDTDENSSDGYPATSRTKKHAPETGSFGKSTRRSRSRGTPAKREDPTILAADAIFSKYLSEVAPAPSESQRKPSVASSQANV